MSYYFIHYANKYTAQTQKNKKNKQTQQSIKKKKRNYSIFTTLTCCYGIKHVHLN